jgi:hypothetical protein
MSSRDEVNEAQGRWREWWDAIPLERIVKDVGRIRPHVCPMQAGEVSAEGTRECHRGPVLAVVPDRLAAGLLVPDA